MVKVKMRVRMKHGVRTKGTYIKKGETVTLVNYPTMKHFYTGYCTVVQKKYGKYPPHLKNIRVSVPKSAIHKTPRKEVLRRAYPRIPKRLKKHYRGKRR